MGRVAGEANQFSRAVVKTGGRGCNRATSVLRFQQHPARERKRGRDLQGVPTAIKATGLSGRASFLIQDDGRAASQPRPLHYQVIRHAPPPPPTQQQHHPTPLRPFHAPAPPPHPPNFPALSHTTTVPLYSTPPTQPHHHPTTIHPSHTTISITSTPPRPYLPHAMITHSPPQIPNNRYTTPHQLSCIFSHYHLTPPIGLQTSSPLPSTLPSPLFLSSTSTNTVNTSFTHAQSRHGHCHCHYHRHHRYHSPSHTLCITTTI